MPLSVPHLSGREWRYVKECLDTGWVSSAGPFVERFERDLAGRLGARHAVATASGTAALHVALRVAGVRAGDEVLVSTLTFIASANAIRYLGAVPVFIDAEPRYAQMDPERVADFLRGHCHRRRGGVVHRRSGRPVRALMPVHILGHPVDLDPLAALAREHGLRLVEDAAEALGARYRGRPVGRPRDIACLSFNGNKIITTGGGGMILTRTAGDAALARYLSTQAKDDETEFVHGTVGYNYRLTNMQAALGCAQLENLEQRVDRKRAIFARYDQAFAGVPGLTPLPEAPWARRSGWLYTLLIDPATFGADSRAVLRHLATRGIQARPLWQPMHRSPAHREVPRPLPCPVADRLNRMALNLPSSVGLTPADQERVIEAVLASPGAP